MTLLELLFVVAILSVVVAGITKVMIDLDRSARARDLNVKLQGEGRDGLQVVERDIRHAALGAGAGIIWTQDSAGSLVRRPAVQIFDNLTGGASLPVKPGTDALLLVGGRFNGAEAAVQGTQYSSTAGLTVTRTGGFSVGSNILAGSYQQAAWAKITLVVPAVGVTPGNFTLSPTVNVYPKGKLDAGALVREARARLYYVNTSDELVQADLPVPRAPGVAELGSPSVVATGVENLQIDCELDSGVTLLACPAPSRTDVTATEATAAFGAWAAGTGTRLGEVTVGTLRSVILNLVMRSPSPLADQQGDAPIAVGNQSALSAMHAGTADAVQPYLRRAYRLPVAVRNVSLGSF